MPAQIFVIMGLSGSGKSTLVRHFNRLIEPSAGQILIGGNDILKLDAAGLRALRRQQMSMVFQNFGLLPHKNVLDNVCYGLSVRGEKGETPVANARRWIERVGLQRLRGQIPGRTLRRHAPAGRPGAERCRSIRRSC